ncbi:hypothetical protein PLICRDRAFT_43310 [Plicaturopsis crispa FD-325 SS-3]|nr:hypothetical protein PLICRDRAFT_43310 [Plicaturopsis crispa FD-325 SS-3]
MSAMSDDECDARHVGGSFSDNEDQRVDDDLQVESSPQRKRARYAASDSSASPSRNPGEGSRRPRATSRASPPIVRDEEYYLADGSCILLVENTLFNVHKTRLSKDSSSFSTMFTLPQGDHRAEGMSDDNPVILMGDSAAAFRHFLWALYALPHELMVVHSPQASLPPLIDIAMISHKYAFKSLETWALDAIQEYVNRKPSPILASIPVTYTFGSTPAVTVSSTSTKGKAKHDGFTLESTAQLTSLIRLAVMCDHARLLATVINLLRQLMSQSLQYAYLAMTLADELDLRSLRGAAYLEVMQKAVVVRRTPSPNGAAEGDVDADGRLLVSPAQQLRLLSGYYRLTSAWERLRLSPPAFEHAPSCGATWHQHGCTQSWQDFWKEKTRAESVLALGLADVLGRLRAISKEFERWGSATYMHHDCRMAARRGINDTLKRIEDALPDYFSEDLE